MLARTILVGLSKVCWHQCGMRFTQNIDYLRGRGANKYESVLMDDGMLMHLNESSVKTSFDMGLPRAW
eukprot:6111156-Amphidinium_carterae.1